MKREETAPEELYSAYKNDTADHNPPAKKVYPIERWLVRRLLQTMGNPPVELILWDGKPVYSLPQTPIARLVLQDRRGLLKLIGNPDLQFGELFTRGRLRVDGDLVAMLEALYRAGPDFENRGLWIKILSKLYLLRPNTLSRSQDNIHRHYDIGNDFYKLWLDPRMVYTCAYFPHPSLTLEQAQLAKLEYVCRKLRLKPGEEVVEAGCGWGALALYMARHHGVKVKAYNISKEQVAYAREQARQQGLQDRVTYIEGDYRDIRGTYNAFVSVGMLEHVGVRHYHALGAVINRCLREQGRGLIHTIGRLRPAPMNPWIEKHIFPGGYPPSLGEMAPLFEPWRFSVVDVENLRMHYAKTLRHWLERFDTASEHIAAMFDPEFVRAWRLYLAGSIASFTAGDLQLFQVVFARSEYDDVPWNRSHLYQDRS